MEQGRDGSKSDQSGSPKHTVSSPRQASKGSKADRRERARGLLVIDILALTLGDEARRGEIYALSQVAGYQRKALLFIAMEDNSHLTYTEIQPDFDGCRIAPFLRNAVAHFSQLGMQIRYFLTDRGTPYTSIPVAEACLELGVRHLTCKQIEQKARIERCWNQLNRQLEHLEAFRPKK